MQNIEFEKTGITVDNSGNSVLHTITLLRQQETIGFAVHNTGASGFTSFKVQVQFHPNGIWHDYISGSDWSVSSPAAPVVSVSNTRPDTLTAGSRSFAVIDVRGIYRVQFVAGTASTSTTASIRG